MAHDYDAQMAETREVYAEMQAEHGLPEVADIDYFFVPASEEADWRPLAEALTTLGFDCLYYDEEDGDPAYLCATLTEQAVSADGIWIGEETATRVALDHGFSPDGWGLEA